MSNQHENTQQDINPANGLPMISGTNTDVAGNVYGSNDTAWQSPYNPTPFSYVPPTSTPFDPWG